MGASSRSYKLFRITNHRFWAALGLIIVLAIIVMFSIAFQQGWFSKIEGLDTPPPVLLKNYPNIKNVLTGYINTMQSNIPKGGQPYRGIVTALTDIKTLIINANKNDKSNPGYTKIIDLYNSAKLINKPIIKNWANNDLKTIINAILIRAPAPAPASRPPAPAPASVLPYGFAPAPAARPLAPAPASSSYGSYTPAPAPTPAPASSYAQPPHTNMAIYGAGRTSPPVYKPPGTSTSTGYTILPQYITITDIIDVIKLQVLPRLIIRYPDTKPNDITYITTAFNEIIANINNTNGYAQFMTLYQNCSKNPTPGIQSIANDMKYIVDVLNGSKPQPTIIMNTIINVFDLYAYDADIRSCIGSAVQYAPDIGFYWTTTIGYEKLVALYNSFSTESDTNLKTIATTKLKPLIDHITIKSGLQNRPTFPKWPESESLLPSLSEYALLYGTPSTNIWIKPPNFQAAIDWLIASVSKIEPSNKYANEIINGLYNIKESNVTDILGKVKVIFLYAILYADIKIASLIADVGSDLKMK